MSTKRHLPPLPAQVVEASDQRQLFVANIPDGWGDENMELLFESRKHFGDTHIISVEHVDFDASKCEAVVTFTEEAHARHVLQVHADKPVKPLKSSDNVLVIRPYLPFKQQQVDGDARPPVAADNDDDTVYSDDAYSSAIENVIVVTGFDARVSHDTLLYYFENTRTSGGGDISSIFVNHEDGFAYITFTDSSVVREVVSREHIIGGQNVCTKSLPVSKIELLLQDVPEDLTEQTLQYFLESKLQDNHVVCVTYNNDMTKAIVMFHKPIYWTKLVETFKRNLLCGVTFEPCKVPVSDGIIVSELPVGVSNDLVCLYFESTSRSDGGPVRSLDLRTEEGYCLVFFENYADVGKVCRRKEHKLHGETIKVQPYSQYFGLPYGIQPVSNNAPLMVKLDPSIVDAYKMSFLRSNTAHKRSLETKLSKCHARVEWKMDPVVIDSTLSSEMASYSQLKKTWEQDVRDIIVATVRGLEVRNKRVEPDTWKQMMQQLTEMEMSHPNEVAVITEKEKRQIVLVATSSVFDASWREIISAINKAVEIVAENKKQVTVAVAIDKYKAKYLIASKFIANAQTELRHVEVDIDIDGNVKFTGRQSDVNDCQLRMYQVLSKICCRETEVEEGHARLLTRDKIRRWVSEKMKRQHLTDVWRVKKTTVEIFADVDNDLDKMEHILKSAVCKIRIGLDAALSVAIQSSKWHEMLKRLKSKMDDCVRVESKDKVMEIFMMPEDKDEVSNAIQSFCKQNAEYDETMSLDPPVARFMEMHMYRQITTEMSKLFDKKLKINWKIDKSGSVSLKGTAESIRQAERILTRFKDGIRSDNKSVKLRKIQQYFSTMKGCECIRRVEQDNTCIIDVMGTGFSKTMRAGRRHQVAMPAIQGTHTCAEVTLDCGAKVVVVSGDITQVDVDVIVNAANKDLKHRGGLAAVIVKQGGYNIQKECEAHIKKHGSLTDGEVYMGKAGHMSFKAIAHAVGPHWEGGSKGEDQVLIKTVDTCLKGCEAEGCESIAIPALSAGAFKYPVDLACQDIVAALDIYFKRKNPKIKKVVLCDISRSTVKAFTDALQSAHPNTKLLGRGDVNVIAGGDDSGQSRPVVSRKASQDPDAGCQDVSLGSVSVSVIQGDITQENTEVIVASCNRDLELNKGHVTKALLQKGGNSIERECKNQIKVMHKDQVVMVTAGKLPSKNIIFVETKTSSREWKPLVLSCLQMAEKHKRCSIAFPALGTSVKCRAEDIANVMHSAIIDFNKDKPKYLKQVKIVVFQDSMVPAFAAEFTGGGGDVAAASFNEGGQSRPRDTSQDPDNQDVPLGSVSVSVIQGDITQENTEVIVASCNRDLELNKGHVTKALLYKGGNSIEKECKAQIKVMHKDQVVMVTAGKLPSKNIIFVETKTSSREWKPLVLSCLQMAEKHKRCSIAFPALGTSVKCRAEDIANVMHSAIIDFNKDDKPKYLKQVKIVVFQDSMVPAFAAEFTEDEGRRPRSSDSGHHDNGGARSRSSQGDEDDEDVFQVTIYAADTRTIQQAHHRLVNTAKSEWHEKTISDPEIRNLSKFRMQKLKDSARNNHVEIHVDTGKESIDIVGPAINVAHVCSQVQEMLRHTEKSQYNFENAKLLAKVAQWFYVKQQKQHAFPKTENWKIETAYNKKDDSVRIKMAGNEYEVDFKAMKEWDVKQPQTKYDVLRRDLMKDVGLDNPKHWHSMKPSETVMLVPLSKTDREYMDVVKEFTQSLGRQPNIDKIERVQNPTLYAQYCAKKIQMAKNCRTGIKIEKLLWHGTADMAVQSINTHGFNRSFCGKNATAFGQGVYFALQSQYSDQPTYTPPDSNGYKRMYRTRVLTGEYTHGNSALRTPPAKNPTTPHILYDSVANNNTSSASVFVIFNDTQAYPEHLITYK